MQGGKGNKRQDRSIAAGNVPVRYYRGPGCDPVRYTGAYSAIASAPGPRNHPSTPFLPVTQGKLSSVMSRFSSSSERIRRPCGEFELSRRRQPERNRIRRTIPHRAGPGPGPARNRWPTAKRPESPFPVTRWPRPEPKGRWFRCCRARRSDGRGGCDRRRFRRGTFANARCEKFPTAKPVEYCQR